MTPDDVRRLALALPEVEDGSTETQLGFAVRGKGFAWSWKERIEPKTPRVPRLDVLAVRCQLQMKQVLLEAEPERLFTEPHYNGFPAVLVRLDRCDEAGLQALLKAAWLCVAPKALAKVAF